jgi:fructose-1-phosphate kinase PfkB-like protein
VWWARPPSIERISSVGSGDAFTAGFAAGSMQRRPFEGRLRLAVACGAANAETVGACNITADRVEELESEVELERLGGDTAQEDGADASN